MSSKSVPSDRLTPLMRQFNEIKAQHPGKILFFRMGDFYEMFGDDAVKAAPILGIALTSRSHGGDDRIPLAGVPYHSADRYLARLLAKGEKVVVVEQVEDPKLAKGLVKREVVEILTPGTATVESTETEIVRSSLAAVYAGRGDEIGLALLELGTGLFVVDQGPARIVCEKLKVMEPAEILIPQDAPGESLKLIAEDENLKSLLSTYEDWNFDYKTATRELNNHFETASLEGFGIADDRAAVIAAGAVYRYLKDNHRQQLDHIRSLTRLSDSDHMVLDFSTVRNLELVKSVATSDTQHSLLGVMDRCRTAAGSRRLRASLLRPFRNKTRIERRLSGVTELVTNADIRRDLRELARNLPDLEKLTGRLGIGKLNPRQAGSIGQALEVSAQMAVALQGCHSPHLSQVAAGLPDCANLVTMLKTALVEEPPLVSSKGHIFKPGYSDRLDELNDSIREARDYIGSLQEIERERTGINSLRVGFNRVFGYYLSVTKTHINQVPEHYIRKQTLVNAERYITPELKEKEELILAAEEKIFALEEELFAKLTEHLGDRMADLLLTARLLAELDLVTALADLAVEHGYCRPEITETTHCNIVEGRHPVVEAVLPSGTFVSNDLAVSVDNERILILTGPNMSGKSTYLRQIGLIVIMAQIGSYVPASKAEIGLVDRVFTRVGAMDNLAGGQSTFLVEMVETANILNNATEKSLVLLDEVGRGTSTFDGLSVAWSVVEAINENCRCRTVFATHYHELTGMAEHYEHIRNYQVAVKKWEDSVVFLHKIIPGGCDDSYGIEVARLAGVPTPTLRRAKQILKLLESGKFAQSELARGVYKEKMQTSLFEPPKSKVEEALREVNLDKLTPIEAFDLIRKLKDELS